MPPATVPVAGLTSLLHGLDSTKVYEAQRNMDYARFTIMGLVAQSATVAVMLVWAWLSPSVWALVAGTVTGVLVRTVLSHYYLRGVRNRFRWEKSALTELVRFGRWMFLSTLITFIALHSDRLIFGKLVTLEELGVYSVAVVWGLLPSAFVGQLIGRITFPLLARAHQSGAPLGPAFREARLPVVMLSGYLSACMIGGAPALIELLYPATVVDAGWIIQLLTIGYWFGGLEAVNAVALMSVGQPKYLAMANAAKVMGMVVTIPVGFELAGFAGAIAGFALPDVAKYLVSVVPLVRMRASTSAQDLGLTALVALTGGAGIGLHAVLSDAHPFLVGLAVFAVVTAGWGTLAYALRKRLRRPSAT